MSLAFHVKELVRYRELLWLWTVRDVRVRYKQSVVGAGWAVLQPLVLMVVFTVVFSVLARVPSPDDIPYPLFSYSGLVAWTFLASSLTFGTPSLVSNLNLVTKTYFPREILPMASALTALLDWAIASAMLLLLMAYYQSPLHLTALWLLLLVPMQLALILGVLFFLSAISVRYRDVRFVVPLAIQIWLFASPVIYPATLVPERWRPWYFLNPMAGLLEAYRATLLAGRHPDPASLGVSAAMALALLVTGYAYFKRREVDFADVI